MKHKITKFNFPEGQIISDKFKIIRLIGSGWESEVYIVEELATGIERAAKFFLPQRNKQNKVAKFYAKKLHKLRTCPVLIQYHTQEKILFKDKEVTYLISEYVDGQPLGHWMKSQPGKRLAYFQALHLLHSLTKGIEDIHLLKEYHGDLHLDNVIVERFGLGFELKVLDMFHWGKATPEALRDDLFDIIRLFYDVLGGSKHYKNQPKEIKEIICGLKRSLISKKFKNVTKLRLHIENLQWK